MVRIHWNQKVVKLTTFSSLAALLDCILTTAGAASDETVVTVMTIWFPFCPSALRAGGVLSSRSGRAGGCQTCGTHISVTAWWIFTVRSSVELSRPVVVPCHGQLPICPIWTCPWAKNSSNLAKIGSRLCGTHISETTGWIYPIWSFMDLSGPVVVQRHSYLPICPIWACPWAKNLSNQAVLST